MIKDPRKAIKEAKYFGLNENWGEIDKVHPRLVQMLDAYRGELNKRVHISPIEGAVYAIGGHTGDSWHYIVDGRNELAVAADVFPEGNLMAAWMTALKMRFTGVGVYPHWHYPAKGLVGGLHLDCRPLLNITTPRALWWMDAPISDEDNGYRSVTNPASLDLLMSHLNLLRG